MSFWKSLFGGSKSGSPAGAGPTATEDYKGFTIAATPYAEGGQFQTAGTISKTIGEETKSHRFVRADRFATVEDATSFTLLKARQIIDQNGDRLFG